MKTRTVYLDERTILILKTIAKMRHCDIQECEGCGRPIEVIEDCEYNDAIDAVEELIKNVCSSSRETR